jgi:methanethiol S-methyltransferase
LTRSEAEGGHRGSQPLISLEILTRKELGSSRVMGSSEFKKTKDKLITTGIYSWARHPRHVEHPLWFIGLGLLLGYVILYLFAIYLFIGLLIATYFEEKELIKRYGKQYLEYKKRTHAFFVI